MTAPVYRLFHSPGACSLSVHIVLETLAQPFEAVRVSIADGAHRRPEYLAINPHGRVPALAFTADDGTSSVLTESLAILLFLADRHRDAGLLPDDPLPRARTIEWLSWLATTMHTGGARLVFRPERFTTATEPVAHAAIADAGRAAVAAGHAEIETRVGGRRYALGDRLSVVDPMLLVHYRWGNRCGLPMATQFPQYTAYVERLAALPAFARAIAREGIRLDG